MENNNEKKLYTLLVYSENIAGILNQITTVFTRRQVNIESLNVSASSIKNIHKYARKEDVPEHTMFVIITDGYENASRKYSSDQVKRMIEHEKEKYGWEFLFIGANIDAVETAKHFGINEDRAVNYHADKKGTEVVYDTVADACCNIRACAPLTADWSTAINDDFNNR